MLVSDPTKFADIQRRIADVQNTYYERLRKNEPLKAMAPAVILELEWLVEEVRANLPELKLDKDGCERVKAAEKQAAELKAANEDAIKKGRFVRELDPSVIHNSAWLAGVIAGNVTPLPQPRRKPKKPAKAKGKAEQMPAPEAAFAEAL